MNQFFKIIPLLLVLTCFDWTTKHLAKADVMSNSSSSGLEIDLLKQETNDSNAVVVNGLRFEAVIPEREWIAPPRGTNPVNTPLNGSTLIPIALQITNQTQEPVRLRFFSTFPILMNLGIFGEGGNYLEGGVINDGINLPFEASCSVLQAGETLTHTISTSIFWDIYDSNQLVLVADIGSGGSLNREIPSPGRYQVQVEYNNPTPSGECYVLSPTPVPGQIQQTIPVSVTDLWTGNVVLPPVEVNIRYQP